MVLFPPIFKIGFSLHFRLADYTISMSPVLPCFVHNPQILHSAVHHPWNVLEQQSPHLAMHDHHPIIIPEWFFSTVLFPIGFSLPDLDEYFLRLPDLLLYDSSRLMVTENSQSQSGREIRCLYALGQISKSSYSVFISLASLPHPLIISRKLILVPYSTKYDVPPVPYSTKYDEPLFKLFQLSLFKSKSWH